MNQEIANKYFASELGQQLDVIYATSDGRAFVRIEEAEKHAEGKLDENTLPLSDKTITTWYPEDLIEVPKTMTGSAVPRPKWNEEMLDELSLKVGTIINNWCNNETPLEDCIESAKKVLKYNLNEDGYVLAKEFEDEGFGSDSQLVEELEDVFYIKDSILSKNIEKWVADNNIKLTLSTNDIVLVKDKGKEVEAKIVELLSNKCQYGVWWDGLSKNTICRIFNAEDVKLKTL